jgi:hypothetical protein
MIRRCVLLGFFVFALMSGIDTARAQAPANPYTVNQANICTTQRGWCQLPALTPYHNAACGCLTAQNQIVQGFTLFFPNPGGPASPYLQHHFNRPNLPNPGYNAPPPVR